MFLYRIPKVESMEELQQINEFLSTKKTIVELKDALSDFLDEKGFIYQPQITIDKYSDSADVSFVPSYHNAAYWRKFNALHLWFVENVQNGVDECEPHIVTEQHIQKLLEVLESLNVDNCAEKFPTRSGFFFGGTEYDEWYWGDVKETIHICHYLLSQVNWEEEVLIYQSSW